LSPTGTVVIYSTYLGGTSSGIDGDGATAVAVDAAGDAYVAGYAQSSDFPTAKAMQGQNNSRNHGANAFVTKFNPGGSALIYSTYLGGSGNDVANAIVVDGAGNAYLAGLTYSTDFPTIASLQAVNNGAVHGTDNAFIAVLNAAGNALEFSTYLGGSGTLSAVQTDCACAPVYGGDGANAIAVDSAGGLYVAGSTYSIDFPTAAAFQDTNKAAAPESRGTAFVTKIAMAPPAVHSQPTGGGGMIDWTWIGVLGLTVAMRLRPSVRLPRYSIADERQHLLEAGAGDEKGDSERNDENVQLGHDFLHDG
jgi:Beta-propeller repeat